MGIDYSFTAETLIKAPVFLTFLSSLVVLFAALGMKETGTKAKNQTIVETVRRSFQTTLTGASWVWRTPLPFGILLASMVLDNVIRQFLTIASAYWSVIDLPLATFGLVASGMSLMGYFIPRVAKKMAEHQTPNQNFFPSLFYFSDRTIWNFGGNSHLGYSTRCATLRHYAIHELLGESIPERGCTL